ncbi:MAG: tetratricopeptide repeat protein [Planctomycetota bacterium]
MKNLPLIVFTVLASAAAAFAVVRMSAKDTAAATASISPTDADLAALSASVASVQAQQAEIAQALADLKGQIVLSDRSAARVPLGEIEAAVARALEARSAVEHTPVVAEHTANPKAKREAFLKRLLDDDVSWDDAQLIWKEAAAEGELDALVALFEEQVRANPNDVQAQVDLGHAYLQKVFQSGGGPEAGKWAIQADQAYAGALKLDDHNWEARFSKAMSLSHWPAVFGKQNEAIQNFEVLVAQQALQSQRPDFVQTHFLLGNMYQQIGEKEKALAAWQKGLTLFPDNASLLGQIASLQGN